MQHVPLAEHRLRVAGLVCGLLLWVTFAFLVAGPTGAPVHPGDAVHRAQDFPQFYALGRLVVEHRSAELQNGEALARVVRTAVSPDIQWTLLPVYGPQVALAMAPFASLPYRAAEIAWLAVSFLLYGLAVYWALQLTPGLQRHRVTTWLLALASPGLFQLTWYGQLSMVALACTVLGCVLWSRGRLFAAGLALGLLAYKPQYGLAVGVLALALRAWPLVAGALLSAGAQLTVAWLYAGAGVMQHYAATLANAPLQLDVLQANRHLMQSLLALTQLAPGGAGIGLALYVVLALLALVLTWRTWQRTTDPRLRFGALTLCGLLVSPHVYVYDLVLLTPALAWLGDWLLDAPAESRPLRWSLALLYLWPVGGLVLTYYAGINAGPVIMLATLALTGREAVEADRFAGSEVRGFAGRRG